MATIMTIRGHVARAKAFYDLDDIYFVLAHPFDWDVARLVSTNIGPYSLASAGENHTFSYRVNGGATRSLSITYAGGYSTSKTAAYVVGQLNSLGDGTVAAVTTDGRVQITAPDNSPDPAVVEILSASPMLGFEVGEISTSTNGGTDVPAPEADAFKLIYPYGYKKISEKHMVVPDADLPGSVTGTVGGNTFDTSVDSGNNSLAFKVDGGSEITVTFADLVSSPISGPISELSTAVVNRINLAAYAVSPDYGSVASVDVTDPDSLKVKLTSPTKGGTSSIQVTAGNDGIGIDVGTYSGTTGGEIVYRLDQFRSVDEADIFTEGARMVHLLAEIRYDELPVMPYAQIGIVTGLVPKNTVPLGKKNLTQAEVEDFGILEFIDHRQMTPRDIDSRETLEIVVEFIFVLFLSWLSFLGGMA